MQIMNYIASKPILLGIFGAFLYAAQLSIEKRILAHPDGSVDKYYSLKNVIVGWGFMVLLLIILFFESLSPSFDRLMDKISYGNLYTNPFLFRMTLVASICAILGVYIYLIGLKLHNFTKFAPIFSSIFLIYVVLFGYFYLNEKITKTRMLGIGLALLAIYFVNKE